MPLTPPCLMFEEQIETSVFFQHFSVSFFLESLIVFSLKNVFWVKCTITQQLLHNLRVALWPCPNSCVLLLSSPRVTVVCGFKYWFIWCPMKAQGFITYLACHLTSYMIILNCILLDNYVRTVPLYQAFLNVGKRSCFGDRLPHLPI